MDKFYAGVASHPAREPFLEQMINSIYDHFDQIFVYLNNYESVPAFLERDKIVPILSSEADGDLKALGKFYMAEKVDGYYFAMDDDLIYPKDYKGYLGHMIDHYMRSAVIGVHATIYNTYPVESYYRGPDRKINYCYRGKATTDSVHMLGTGTMAFHTDTLRFNWREFADQKNMLDPQMCQKLQLSKTPVISVTRADNWITEQPNSQKTAIWLSVQADDSVQTKIINSIGGLKHYPAKVIDRKRLGGASVEYGLVLWMLRNIKHGSKVVELGSGNASKEIAKAFKLTSIEHNEDYLNSHDNVKHAPLVKRWYDTAKAQRN